MTDDDESTQPPVRPAIVMMAAAALLLAGAAAIVSTRRKAALDAPANDTNSGVRVASDLHLHVTGHVAPLLVSRAIRAQFPALRACIPVPKERVPALIGTVSLSIAALPTGKVLAVFNAQSTYPDRKVVECMIAAAHAIVLPPSESGGALMVNCPLRVQGAEILEPTVPRFSDPPPGYEPPAPVETINANE